MGRFLDLRAKNKPLTIAGDGKNTRDYVHVQDVVRANILAAKSPRIKKGEVINIGSGRETSVNDLAGYIGGQVTHDKPRQEPHRSVADISRAHAMLDWTPAIPLEEGIARLKSDLGI